MTYARKTLSEIKLIHGDYGNFIKGQKLQKDKEKKYKTPPYQDLAASTEVEGETLNEKCWPGYEKKGMKTMFGKRYPNCVKKKKTRKEDFSDWRNDFEQIDEKKMTKAQIKKRDEIADAISTKDMKDRYGDKNVKYAIATKLAMKEGLDDDDKPFVKKLVGKLRKGSKTHAKQADDLEKAMKENVNVKFALTPNKKSISLNYGDTTLAHRTKETYKSPTSPKVAISKSLVKFKKKDDFVKKNIGENITDEALTIQDWNVDDIKFTEIEAVDIIKPKPLKPSPSNWINEIELDEGFKTRMIAKFVKKLIKNIGKVNPFTKTGAQRVTQSVSQVKKYIPPDKITSQNIQTKSVVNQAKKLVDMSKKPNKGTKAVKVDLSKPIDFDKYLGKTPNKIQKKFGSETPTGTFTDDLPPVKTVPLKKSQTDLMKKTSPKKIKKKFTMKDKLKEIENDPMSKQIQKEIEKETGTKTRKFSQKGGVTKGNENEILSNVKPKPKKPLKDHYDWRTELDEDWQKVNRKDKTDGLSKKAVKAYRRENPGSKLKTAVTKDPKKLKKGSKDAKRRLSFCRRMKGMKKRLTSAKTARDPDSRINKALRRWNC